MSTISKQWVIPGLGYLGVIPFAVAAYFALQGSQLWQLEPVALFVAYSAVILALLGGSLWGKGETLKDSMPTSVLLIASNLTALFSWASLIFSAANFAVAISGLMLGYVVMLFIEQRFAGLLFRNQAASYLNLRLALTTLVVLTHLLVLLSLL